MDDDGKMRILRALNDGLRMANPFYAFMEDDARWEKKMD